MNTDPKAAADNQEWTADRVREILYAAPFDTVGHQNLADAINASITAEREKVRIASKVMESDRLAIADRDEQLAAEREKFLVEHEVQLSWKRQCSKLREQLAAVEKSGRNTGWNEGREHERKCAAAAQQPLVDALKFCLSTIRHEHGSSQMRACIMGDAALSKVKEGK